MTHAQQKKDNAETEALVIRGWEVIHAEGGESTRIMLLLGPPRVTSHRQSRSKMLHLALTAPAAFVTTGCFSYS